MRTIDPAKGYRIHVNTRLHSELTPTFEEVHAGTPLESSQWYPADPDLKDRETRIVRTIDDLLHLMQTGDHVRLANSVVIFGTQIIAWKDFFIRENRDDKLERFRSLYNRVAKGDTVPCALLFEATERKTVGLWRDKKNAAGEKTGAYHDIWLKGQALKIDRSNVDIELFYSYLKNETRTTFPVPKGQLILATGMAQRSYASAHGETVRLYVDHRDATLWVTRKELSTPPPPRKPLPPPTFNLDDMGRLD